MKYQLFSRGILIGTLTLDDPKQIEKFKRLFELKEVKKEEPKTLKAGT